MQFLKETGLKETSFKDIRSIDDLVKKIKECQIQVLIGLGIVAFIIGGVYGLGYYKQRREERAYQTLVSAMKYFDAPVAKKSEEHQGNLDFLEKKEFSTEKEKWERVASTFKDAYDSYSGAGIAPIFLAYRAEALVQLDKLDEAIEVLRQAIAGMSNGQTRELYQAKLALMLLDTKEEKEASVGLETLKKLAADEQSVVRDLALYHLGQHYWYAKNFIEAKNYWNQLLLSYKSDGKGASIGDRPSPWVALAQEKLRVIDRDVE
ncbi:tetratricopeptide repeat protein [Candidatus Babeliales bacterium]|nr:tetratricopeptide repeat protein [Candidatus Babeliales bacterium]